MDNNDNSGILSSIVDFLVSIIEGIANLPSLILDGLKAIFIPDVETIKLQFSNTVDAIERSLGLHLDSVGTFFDGLIEAPVTDHKSDYTIPGVGTFNLTFFDSDFLTQGVDYFRPLIRGFTVFMLLLYNISQVLTLIGQDPGIVHGARADAEEHLMKKSGRFLGGGKK